MQMLTTITPKFQVHIPSLIRKKAGLKRHGRAIIRVEKNKIVIQPIANSKKIFALAGKFKVKHPIPVEKIRDYIEYAQKGRY